jgi:glycosyltransferase involved in cell wall biosynthesis
MKIVVISHAMTQEAARARWQRLTELHSVEVALLIPNRWESNWFGDLRVWRPQPYREGRFQIIPSPVTHYAHGQLYFFKSFDAQLRQLKPDVIYVVQEESSRVLQQMILYRRLWAAQAKLVFFSWNNLGISLPGRLRGWQWRTVRTFTDMAIAGNCEVKQVFERAGYRKPIVVQTEIGVDETAFKPDPKVHTCLRAELGLNGFVIGYAGRVTDIKGLPDLFAALTELCGDWSLLVVGDGDLRVKLETEARAKSWSAHFAGHIGIDDMPTYFQAMDCLVLPSRTTPGWKEQFGLVLAQAMACRVPVIGSNSGAIPEVIGDAGLIFPEGDVNTLCECLHRLMTDVTLREQLAQRGYERALSRYSATALADETYSIFSELLLEKG